MKSIALFALLAISMSATTSAAGDRNAVGRIAPESADNAATDLLVAYQDQELQRRNIALLMAPVKSRAELAAHIDSSRFSGTPLDQLTPKARKRFLASITFNKKGITGFNYGDLEYELSAKQAYRILSLFGAQHTTAMLKNLRIDDEVDKVIMSTEINGPKLRMLEDHKEYRCMGAHNCYVTPLFICMSGC